MVGGVKMEIPTNYNAEDKYKALVFANADETGNITEVICGRYIIPDKQYQFFFYVDRYISDSIDNYKIINGQLTAIDNNLETQLKNLYFA